MYPFQHHLENWSMTGEPRARVNCRFCMICKLSNLRSCTPLIRFWEDSMIEQVHEPRIHILTEPRTLIVSRMKNTTPSTAQVSSQKVMQHLVEKGAQ